MKSSRLKQKNELKKKSKKKFVAFEDPTNKFRNETFKKLYERSQEPREKSNTIEYSEQTEPNQNKKSNHSPRSISSYKDRNKTYKSKLNRKDYYENLSKSRKNLLELVQDKDDPELYPTNVIRTKKVFRDPYNTRKYKDYPNLIGGVLNQANYYNDNENKNYNDSIRYKPLDDIFNEQSSISTRKVAENNNISPNISFNSDFKHDLKSDHILNQNAIKKNQKNDNNLHKIKVDEDNNNTIDNNENNAKNADKSEIQKVIGEYINTNTDINDNIEEENNANKVNNNEDEDIIDKDKFEKGLKEENKLTSGNNNKYKINLHSIMGNGIFKFKGQKYPLGLETAFKEDISIILYNDKKYDMEFEVVNQRFSSVDSNYDFVFTIEYTIETGNELQYPITLDKRNSFNFYKSGNFDTFSFYLDRKEITSDDLNMNIKIHSSGNYEIKSYFADAELN